MQPLSGGNSVELPVEQHEGATTEAARVASEHSEKPNEAQSKEPEVTSAVETVSKLSAAEEAAALKAEPAQPSDIDTGIPSTPASTHQPSVSISAETSPSAKSTSRPTVPAVPVIPAVPKPDAKEVKAPASVGGDEKQAEKPKIEEVKVNGSSVPQTESAADTTAQAISGLEGNVPIPAPASAPVPQKPKSWASLLSTPTSAARAPSATASGVSSASSAVGATASASTLRNGSISGLPRANSESLAEALRSYRVGATSTISQIEPRGLINGGNMCYMNSVSSIQHSLGLVG